MSTLPTIVLVGRVNVGKSTLFNRLIEEHKAIVSPIAGTTRTNNEGRILWHGQEILIIDTGGLSFDESVLFETDILKQSERALKLADLILFVTDAQTGLIPAERELAKRLRRKKIPTLVIANKADTAREERELDLKEWYSLGLGEPIFLSANSGRRTGDLLEKVYDILEIKNNQNQIRKTETENSETPATELQISNSITVTIIGKPNVGKSSLFNKLIKDEKAIVSNIAHTTREPLDTMVTYENYELTFVDTAGIRRKANVDGALERQGISKSLNAIEKSDIVLFVLDGSVPISSQDQQLGGLLEKRGKSVLIILNKWDLAPDQSDAKRNEAVEMIHNEFPHLGFAPVLLISGLSGYHVHQIFPDIIKAWIARHQSIADTALRQLLFEAKKHHLPSRGKGTRQPDILGLTQIAAAPPVMELTIKYRTSLHRSYINFLERVIRERFNFFATPIILKMRKMRR